MAQADKAGDIGQGNTERDGGAVQRTAPDAMQGNTQGGQQGNRQQAEEQRGTFDEADIGSGQKTPGQRETEEQIKSIPPLPQNK